MPNSMDECVYFTRRDDEIAKIVAWAKKVPCLKCKKGMMGKPVEKGKVKIRATEYVCPECGHTEEKKEHEKQLTVEVIYTCKACGHSGDATTEYKRKAWNGVPSFVFVCDGCKAKIGITKKMKAPKKK